VISAVKALEYLLPKSPKELLSEIAHSLTFINNVGEPGEDDSDSKAEDDEDDVDYMDETECEYSSDEDEVMSENERAGEMDIPYYVGFAYIIGPNGTISSSKKQYKVRVGTVGSS
jgi:hypothetical protein